MEPLIIFAVTVIALLLFGKWRANSVVRGLEDRPAPDGAVNGVLYYFHHPLCGPCRRMTPQIHQLAEQHPERVQLVNVAEQRELAQAFGIRVTPTVVLVEHDRISRALVGSQSGRRLESLLK
jgi:thiol-disulfide isomerase/thioredoxin